MKMTKDEAVLEVQKWTNEVYGTHLIACGYGLVDETGYTGWDTVYGLIIGLQVELGLDDASLSPNFGPTTIGLLEAYGDISEGVNDSNGNINQILKGGCLSTGYYPGYFDNEFDRYLTQAIQELQDDIGIAASGVVDPKTFKALLTMNAYVLLEGGSNHVREFQQWLNSTYGNKSAYYYYPCDGLYSRECQEAIIYGIQYECGLDDVANGWFGPTTQSNLKEKGLVYLNDIDTDYNFVHLFKGAFLCNNPEAQISFNGVYDPDLYNAVIMFQEFTNLAQTGNGDFATWAELLVSTGDETRSTTGLDCSIEKVTVERAKLFKESGYEIIGRYLTNEGPSGDAFDKKLEQFEIDAIFAEGMSIFPIFQTYHHLAEHFTYENGKSDAEKAHTLALTTYGIPKGTCIYFPVDYDAYEYEVNGPISEYFLGVVNSMSSMGYYKVGAYGARNTCSILEEKNLIDYSFVSGMSIGFSGNLGYPLPNNWSFNQIFEDLSLGIDHDVVSGRDLGFNTQIKIPEDMNQELWDYLDKIYELTFEYMKEGEITQLERNKLITNYYRKPNYDSGAWVTAIGFTKHEWISFLKEKGYDPEEREMNTIYNPSDMYEIGLEHLMASIEGIIHTSYTSEIDVLVNDFCGWTGDFVTLYAGYFESDRSLSATDYVLQYCGQPNLESTYPYDDYMGDCDAYAMKDNLNDTSIVDIIKNYYQEDYKYRYNRMYSRFNSNDDEMLEICQQITDPMWTEHFKTASLIDGLFTLKTKHTIEGAFDLETETEFINAYIQVLHNFMNN